MRPFRFRLEALLGLRMREEDSAKEAMAIAEGRRVAAEQAVHVAEAALTELDRALSEQRQGRLQCREHLVLLHATDWQRRECERLSQMLLQATVELEAKRALLREARRAREVVTRLKERHQEEHRLDTQRREDLEISDLLGARHALSRAASLALGT